MLLVAVGVALALQFFGQPTPIPNECAVSTTITTTPDASQDLIVTTGDVFAVVLDANPTTGYSWSITMQPDASVAVALDSQFIPPSVALPGAPGRECFRFQAADAGQTSVAFAYARPFEPGAPPVQTADVRVSVTAPSGTAPSESGPSVPVQLPAH